MPTSTNNHINLNKENWKQPFIVVAFLLAMLPISKFGFDIGGEVRLTFQTLVLCLFFYYSKPIWKTAGVILYLLLGIVGLPVFNGGEGWDYFSQTVPLFFFIGFVISSFVPKSQGKSWPALLTYFVQVHLVIVLIGLIGIAIKTKTLATVITTLVELIPGLIIKSGIALLFVLIAHRIVKH